MMAAEERSSEGPPLAVAGVDADAADVPVLGHMDPVVPMVKSAEEKEYDSSQPPQPPPEEEETMQTEQPPIDNSMEIKEEESRGNVSREQQQEQEHAADADAADVPVLVRLDPVVPMIKSEEKKEHDSSQPHQPPPEEEEQTIQTEQPPIIHDSMEIKEEESTGNVSREQQQQQQQQEEGPHVSLEDQIMKEETRNLYLNHNSDRKESNAFSLAMTMDTVDGSSSGTAEDAVIVGNQEQETNDRLLGSTSRPAERKESNASMDPPLPVALPLPSVVLAGEELLDMSGRRSSFSAENHLMMSSSLSLNSSMLRMRAESMCGLSVMSGAFAAVEQGGSGTMEYTSLEYPHDTSLEYPNHTTNPSTLSPPIPSSHPNTHTTTGDDDDDDDATTDHNDNHETNVSSSDALPTHNNNGGGGSSSGMALDHLNALGGASGGGSFQGEDAHTATSSSSTLLNQQQEQDEEQDEEEDTESQISNPSLDTLNQRMLLEALAMTGTGYGGGGGGGASASSALGQYFSGGRHQRDRLESWGGMSDISMTGLGGGSGGSNSSVTGPHVATAAAALAASALHHTGIIDDVTAAAAALDQPFFQLSDHLSLPGSDSSKILLLSEETATGANHTHTATTTTTTMNTNNTTSTIHASTTNNHSQPQEQHHHPQHYNESSSTSHMNHNHDTLSSNFALESELPSQRLRSGTSGSFSLRKASIGDSLSDGSFLDLSVSQPSSLGAGGDGAAAGGGGGGGEDSLHAYVAAAMASVQGQLINGPTIKPKPPRPDPPVAAPQPAPVLSSGPTPVANNSSSTTASNTSYSHPIIMVDHDAIASAVHAATAAAGTIDLSSLDMGGSGISNKIPSSTTTTTTITTPLNHTIQTAGSSQPHSSKDMDAIRARARAAAGYVPPTGDGHRAGPVKKRPRRGNSPTPPSSRSYIPMTPVSMGTPFSASSMSSHRNMGPSATPRKALLPPQRMANGAARKIAPSPYAYATPKKGKASPKGGYMSTPGSELSTKSSGGGGQSNQKWDDMLQCLEEFIVERRKEETKDMTEEEKKEWEWEGNVPTTYKTKCGKALGRWINNQRSAKSKCILKREREDRLVSTGLKWSVLTTHVWTDMMEELRIYVQEKIKDGKPWDGNVPTNYRIKGNTADDGTEIDEEKNLGRWINRQRCLFQGGKLKLHRQKELEKIGLKWSVLSTASWDSMYESLVEYAELKKKDGDWDGNVPANYKTEDNPPKSLGRWVNRQRSAYAKDKLKDEFVEKLEVIGLKWTVHERKSRAILLQPGVPQPDLLQDLQQQQHHQQ